MTFNNFIKISLWFCLIFGTISHFLFNLSGNNFLVGLFFPQNESVFEHLKLAFTPISLIFAYFIISKKLELSNKVFVAFVVCVFSAVLMIIFFYYTYTYGFGLKSVVFDISNFIISMILSHKLANFTYNIINEDISLTPYISAYVILFIIIIFCSVFPLNVPIFISNV